MNHPYFDSLKKILAGMNVSVEITENLALLADSVLDSLEFMNYITQVEEAFNIKISDADIEKFKLGIISNMIKYLEERKKG